ncbi:MAG: B12-binding domain-containing radical SAM protein [Myxococcota bacterium]|jgi:radical SAM superfamily enzyme YgiQ (UPF0313 family)|nr:B12-binding domain-containing radical SAM protein [Myxococcota bacterium]
MQRAQRPEGANIEDDKPTASGIKSISMRVVLVHPAGSNFVSGARDVTMVANRMVPSGLVSIAAYLERAGHEVFCHDCLGPNAPLGIEANARLVLDRQPDIVGLSATTSSFLDAVEIAALIKSRRPQTMTICGGVHASAIGAPLLSRFASLDFLALGEGEETMRELCDGTPPSRIEGLVWRQDQEILTNAPRTLLPQLDALPFPAYEKLAGFPRGYQLPPFSYAQKPGASLATSRGCVYQCSYCDRSVFRKGFRSNSAHYTFEHMRYLRQRFGLKHLNIYDDLFTTNRGRILELCEQLAKARLGLQFNCAVRVGHADDELLSALSRAGCLMISVGIESGDPRMLEDLKAGVTLDQVRQTVAAIQRHGLRAKGLFMMGVVGETPQSVERTSDFILELGLDDMNLSKFTPFPGAPCYATIRDHGSFEEDWRLMNALNFVFVPRAFQSREQLDELYNRHVKRFYSDPQWRKRFRGRLWQHRHTLLHMAKNLPAFLAAKKQFEPRGH